MNAIIDFHHNKLGAAERVDGNLTVWYHGAYQTGIMQQTAHKIASFTDVDHIRAIFLQGCCRKWCTNHQGALNQRMLRGDARTLLGSKWSTLNHKLTLWWWSGMFSFFLPCQVWQHSSQLLFRKDSQNPPPPTPPRPHHHHHLCSKLCFHNREQKVKGNESFHCLETFLPISKSYQ